MNKRRGVGILLILALVTVSFLTVWYTQTREVKVPKFDPDKYLYDKGRMVNKEDEEVITGLLRELDVETDAKLLVVTVKNLPNTTIEEFADEVFEDWELDKLSIMSKYENALLVFNKKTNEVALKVTSGLKDVLSEERFTDIRRKRFEPSIATKDYNMAVKDTAHVVTFLIADKYDADITNLRFKNLYGNPFLEFAIIIGALIICLSTLVFLLNKDRT